MLRIGRTLTFMAVTSAAGLFCFAGGAQAELIKLSNPWKGKDIIETDDIEDIQELEHIRGTQQDEKVEKQLREVLLERAANEPLLLRGEADEHLERL